MNQENKQAAFVLAVFRGIGQIMLQRNALTGIIFLAGIFVNSVLFGFTALISAIFGTLAAYLFKYAPKDIDDGLYGFNGALTGIAVFVFFEPGLLSGIALLSGTFVSTYVMHKIKKRLPAYTAPFVVTAWGLILLLKWFGAAEVGAVQMMEPETVRFGTAVGFGLGQVMFQPNLITGIIFLAGIAVHSRTAAAWALVGAAGGALFALALSLPAESINNGIWGYNAVLCAIALGNLKLRGFVLAFAGILLSVLVNLLMSNYGIITLTAPFVLATWAVLAADYLSENKKQRRPQKV